MRTLFYLFWTTLLLSSARSQPDQPPTGRMVELSFSHARITLPFDVHFASKDSATVIIRSSFHPNYDVDGLLYSMREGISWHARLKFYNVGFISMEQLQDEIPRLDLLDELRKRVNKENEQREREGYQTVVVTRIIEPPQLDPERQLLEFAVETLQDTLFSIERHLFFFSAAGFLHAVVTVPISAYAIVKPWTTELFATLAFNAGSRYSDRDPNVIPEVEGGFGAAFFNREPHNGGWVMPVVVSFIVLASFGLLYYDRLFPKKKQTVATRRGRPLRAKTPLRRL